MMFVLKCVCTRDRVRKSERDRDREEKKREKEKRNDCMCLYIYMCVEISTIYAHGNAHILTVHTRIQTKREKKSDY